MGARGLSGYGKIGLKRDGGMWCAEVLEDLQGEYGITEYGFTPGEAVTKLVTTLEETGQWPKT